MKYMPPYTLIWQLLIPWQYFEKEKILEDIHFATLLPISKDGLPGHILLLLSHNVSDLILEIILLSSTCK